MKIFSRILLPIMIVLILLPPLSCIIFYQTAKQYAYDKAAKELEMIQKEILPLMENSFSDKNTEDNDNVEQVRNFLKQITPLLNRINGNSEIMIFSSHMQMVYPKEEQKRQSVISLAQEWIEYIQNTNSTFEHTIKWEANNGEKYIVNIYKVPTSSVRIKYMIAYCPTSQIGDWIAKASTFVLVISSLFVILLFAVICMVTRSITQPIYKLCKEVEKIGKGNFIQITPEYSLKELEELRLSINQMSYQLLCSDESQKNFFQNVSHELRNPLMSISGYAQGIEQSVFPCSKEAARIIMSESKRLTELVNSLLTLSRLESSQQYLEFTSVCIAYVIEDTLDRLNGLAVQKNVSIVLNHFDHNIMVYGEEELIEKILYNLLTNAIRYTKSLVTVTVTLQQNQIAVSVSDDGDGIDKKDLPHLFERCYKGKGGNFGIGLAIAQSAVEKMGGILKAENKPECGAIFTFYLKNINS